MRYSLILAVASLALAAPARAQKFGSYCIRQDSYIVCAPANGSSIWTFNKIEEDKPHERGDSSDAVTNSVPPGVKYCGEGKDRFACWISVPPSPTDLDRAMAICRQHHLEWETGESIRWDEAEYEKMFDVDKRMLDWANACDDAMKKQKTEILSAADAADLAFVRGVAGTKP